MSRPTRDGTASNPSHETKFSGANADREIFNIHFPCSADHVQDSQPYPVDPYSCCMCVTIYILNPFPPSQDNIWYFTSKSSSYLTLTRTPATIIDTKTMTKDCITYCLLSIVNRGAGLHRGGGGCFTFLLRETFESMWEVTYSRWTSSLPS